VKEITMKRSLRFLATAATVALGAVVFAQAPEIAYDANADFLSLPANTYLGEVAGVATNSRGHVFVYTRVGHAYATLGDERTFYHGGSRLFQFDQNGRFVKEIGQGTYGMNFAQQVRVDPQDNIWVVDRGSNQVLKFDPEGRIAYVFGRKPESIGVRPGPGTTPLTMRPADYIPPPPGTPEPPPPAPGAGRGGRGGANPNPPPPGTGVPGDNFNRPSDVTWDRAGNFYVADGMGNNNRVVKFDKDGHYLKTIGQTGSAPAQFNRVHGIVSDAQGNLYVADAGNHRIQVLDSEGNFKSEIKDIGTPQALCITSGPTQYLYSSNSNDSESMDNGEIYKISLSGQIVGKFGKAGKLPKEFGIVNAIDCRTETDLLVGEIWNWRVQKVTLRR
jgi:sugar lactone lactonase YvrE